MGISASAMSALQEKQRQKLGLSQMGFGFNSQSSTPYTQDRLIASISIIKEVLQSNMQLRDDLLNMGQDHE